MTIGRAYRRCVCTALAVKSWGNQQKFKIAAVSSGIPFRRTNLFSRLQKKIRKPSPKQESNWLMVIRWQIRKSKKKSRNSWKSNMDFKSQKRAYWHSAILDRTKRFKNIQLKTEYLNWRGSGVTSGVSKNWQKNGYFRCQGKDYSGVSALLRNWW